MTRSPGEHLPACFPPLAALKSNHRPPAGHPWGRCSSSRRMSPARWAPRRGTPAASPSTIGISRGKKKTTNKQKNNLHSEGDGRQMLLAWALPPVRHVCAPAGPQPQLEQVWAVPGSPKPPPRALIIRTGPRSAAHGRASKPLKDSAGERRAVSVAGSRRGAEGRGTEPRRGTDLGVPSQGRAVHGWEPPLPHPAAPDVWPGGKGSVVLGVNHTLSLPPAAARQLGRSPLANGPQLALALERQRVREQRAQPDEAHRSLLGPLGFQGARDTGEHR